MELLLNLVWLLLTLAAFARCAAWAARESDRRRMVAVSLATVCMVALLFPIISITDDLHESVAVLEESASLRRITIGAAVDAAPLLAVVVGLLTGILIPALSIFGFVTEAVPSFCSSPAVSTLTFRGPPSAAR